MYNCHFNKNSKVYIKVWCRGGKVCNVEEDTGNEGLGKGSWRGYEFRVDENDVRDDGTFDVSTRRELCSFDSSVSVLCPLSRSSTKWRPFSSTPSPRLEFESFRFQPNELYAGGGGYDDDEACDDEDEVVRSISKSLDCVVKIAGRKNSTPLERRRGRTGVMGTSSRGLAMAETRFRTLLKASVIGLEPRPA